MLRADFEGHPLWQMVEQARGYVGAVRDLGLAQDMPALERIETQISYVRSFLPMASTRVEFFTPGMLNGVQAAWTQVVSSLQARQANVNNFALTVQAASQAESALEAMAPWPRHYGRGGEVTQMETLFQDLLEAQRKSLEALGKNFDALGKSLDDIEANARAGEQKANSTLEGIQEEAERARDTVEKQKQRIDEVISQGLTSVNDIRAQYQTDWANWSKERESEFQSDFQPFRDEIEGDLATADEMLASLREKHKQYERLVGAIAADEIAQDFKNEARWGRWAGLSAYALGVLLLAGAAVPLVFLLQDPALDTAGAPNWGKLIVRLSIAVLAGSAATVVIRLGARLISNANASKRMELEMRSVGPFLSNVDDKPEVDKALLGLVDRSFGRTLPDDRTDSPAGDEQVPVTTIAQLFAMVQKLVK